MSRHGYNDDCSNEWQFIRWRGAVTSAIRGKRGQAFLREMLIALDTVAQGRLIANNLENADGDFCALGTVGKARGLDMADIDPEDLYTVTAAFGIPRALAAEIMYENDEGCYQSSPETRFDMVRRWVESHIKQAQ